MDVIVVLADSCFLNEDKIDQVLEVCVANGFRLTKQLTTFSMLFGQIPKEKLEDLRSISGVRFVEEDEQCEVQ